VVLYRDVLSGYRGLRGGTDGDRGLVHRGALGGLVTVLRSALAREGT